MRREGFEPPWYLTCLIYSQVASSRLHTDAWWWGDGAPHRNCNALCFSLHSLVYTFGP